MRYIELFKLLGTIAVDNSKANAAIDETTGKAEKSEGRMSSTFKKIGTAIAAGFAVDKIKDFGLACINSAAEVKATESQFSQVFGDLKAKASEALQSIADDTGIVESRMKGSYTKIAAFAKTTGMDTASALDLSNRAMIAVADSAAYYDRSLEDTTESLQSFLKGNYENDAALGLSATETTRNAAANKLYGKSFIDLSESQKQLTLLQMVEDANKLSGAMGQAARESDGWENVTGNLRESIKKLMVEIGKPALKAAVPIVQKLSAKFQELSGKVKDAQKWFKEHESAVKAVGKAITVATAAFIAFKAAAEIQGVINMFQQAQVTIALYTASTQGATIAQGLLNGQLTLGESIVALLTGKMTLAAGAQALMTKAQTAMNAVMSANPIGLVVTAVVALTTALVLFESDAKGANAESAKFTQEMKKLNESTKEYEKSMKDLAKERNNTIKEGLSEMNYYQGLADELDTITDKNGNVKKGYEDRAGFITETLSEALGMEIELTDGVIQGYDKICDAIDRTIEKKQAEIILSAYEEEYKTAVQQRGELLDGLALKQKALSDAQNEYNAYVEAGGSTESARYSVLKATLDDAQKNYDDYANLVKNNSKAISNYEAMAADVQKGSYDKVITASGKLGDAYVDLTSVSKEELETQRKTVKDKLNAIEKYYEKTGDESVLTMRDSLRTQLKEIDDKLGDMSSTVKKDNRFPSAVKTMADNARQKIKKSDWEKTGKNIVEGVEGGVIGNIWKGSNAVMQLGSRMLSDFERSLSIHSPSKVFEERGGKNIVLGVASGLVKFASLATKEARKLGEKVIGATEETIDNMDIQKNIGINVKRDIVSQPVLKGIRQASAFDYGVQPYKAVNIDATNSENAVEAKLDKLILMLASFFPEILNNMGRDIVLDDGTLIGRLDERMEAMKEMKMRGI